jgi:hypothetical protein
MNRKGFAPIIIVLVVVGVLVVGGISYYIANQPRGAKEGVPNAPSSASADRDLRRLSDLKLVFNELELYYNQCGYYPGIAIKSGTCSQSHTLVSTWGNASSGLMQALLNSNPGITFVPQDPLMDSAYYYGTDPAGDHYIIAAKLENAGSPTFSYYTPPPLNGFVVHGLSSCAPPFYCMTQ